MDSRIRKVALALVPAVLAPIYLAYELWIRDIAPRWVWATDACPAQEVVCGAVPISPFVFVAGIVLLLGAGSRLHHRIATPARADE